MTTTHRRDGSFYWAAGLPLALLMLALVLPETVAQTPAETPRTIRVVMDNAYAPYSFRSDDGELQGILIDQWRAWERKTGIKVEIHALDWDQAMRRMRAGEFDVIDSIVETAERRDNFDFTRAYTPIEASIFFRHDISGITDIASLKGFAIGVKAGDQHIDQLKANGVTTVILFQNNDEIIDAAKEHKINVFVVDDPSALYLLNKAGIAADFRHSAPIFRDELRRAVRKGDTNLLRTVSEGFAAIEARELKQIDEKWFGRAINRIIERYLTYAGYTVAAALLIIGGLTVWNRTLRKRVLKRTAALHESEQRFRELAENIHEVFWLSNRQNTETMYVSPAYEKIWGCSRDSLYAAPQSWMNAIHPEDRLRVSAETAKQRLGETYEATYRIVRPDGSIRWIRDRGFPVRDESGAVVRFAGIAEDITERKEAEATLRQLAEVSAASSDYLALIGRDFRYRFVNEVYLKARRLRPENMIGRHMQEIVGRERFEQLGRPQVEACLRGEKVETFEWTDFGSGLSRFLHVKVTPFREPDGTISGAVMSGRDITERKQAEDAQHESEQRFGQLAENINEVFWVWTAKLRDAQCLYVSPAYATIWGRSCESLYAAPQSWREAIHPDDKERVVGRIAQLDLEKADDVTYRIVRPDQSIRWIRDQMFPVRDGRGVVVRVAGIAQDITESKEAEVAIRKASRHLRLFSRRRIQVQEDERRRLSRELHDQIGQSITAAKINVEALRPGTRPEFLDRLDETADVLDRLLGQVRQIALDLRPSILDDLGLVPALRSLLDQHGQRAAVAVRFSSGNMPENLDAEIQTTCFRIAQEAITNAVRHATATHIDVDLHCENGDVRLLVRDNGKGFDIATAQTKSVELGLIGMKERAALVGGRTKIKSSPGKGTTIEVTLPLALQSEPPDDFIEK